MEPVFMVLAHSTATAAVQAIDSEVSVRRSMSKQSKINGRKFRLVSAAHRRFWWIMTIRLCYNTR